MWFFKSKEKTIEELEDELAGVNERLNQMNRIIWSGNKIPFYYVEERDNLADRAGKLESKIHRLQVKSKENNNG